MRVEGTQAGGYVGGGAQNPEIRAFDKQIEAVRKQIADVKADTKMPEDVKKERLKALNEQLTQLQADKRARQMEIARDEREKAEKAMAEQAKAQEAEKTQQQEGKEQPAAVDQDAQKAMIQADTYQVSTRAMGALRAKLEGELFAAENGSYLTPADPGAASEIRAKLTKVYEFTGQKAQEANEAFEDEAKVDKAEKDEEEKTVLQQREEEEEQRQREEGFEAEV